MLCSCAMLYRLYLVLLQGTFCPLVSTNLLKTYIRTMAEATCSRLHLCFWNKMGRGKWAVISQFTLPVLNPSCSPSKETATTKF